MLTGAVRAMREQKAFVDAHPQYRAAYRAGMRVARGYNGRRLAQQIADKMLSGRTTGLGRDLATLTRYAPERLMSLPPRLFRNVAGRSRSNPVRRRHPTGVWTGERPE